VVDENAVSDAGADAQSRARKRQSVMGRRGCHRWRRRRTVRGVVQGSPAHLGHARGAGAGAGADGADGAVECANCWPRGASHPSSEGRARVRTHQGWVL
jgi:hypothetical protein